MNNEEKILEMLAGMRSDIAEMKATQVEQGKTLAEQGRLLEEIDQRSIRTQVLLETDYADKLQLLYEGHQTLLETLAPKDRVEALEDDVAMMKDVIKLMRQEISELKKAQ